jgi:hypothetical protein
MQPVSIRPQYFARDAPPLNPATAEGGGAGGYRAPAARSGRADAVHSAHAPSTHDWRSDDDDDDDNGVDNDVGSRSASRAGLSHTTSDVVAGMTALRTGMQSLMSLFDSSLGRPPRAAPGGGGVTRGWFDHDPFTAGGLDIMSLLMGLSGGGDGEWGGAVVSVRVNRWTPGAAAAAQVTPQLQAQLYASLAAAPHRLRQTGRPWRTDLIGEGAIDAGGPFAGEWRVGVGGGGGGRVRIGWSAIVVGWNASHRTPPPYFPPRPQRC